jgi:hypothetical protein
MTKTDVTAYRLYLQQISHQAFKKPGDLVGWMGAMQAQDYPGARWSMGLRLPDTNDAAIEKAIGEGKIVRTWMMRGTLHFVAQKDIRWMLKLLTPRIIAASAGRHRQLELEETAFSGSKKLFARALRDGRSFTRKEMYALLEDAGISTAGQRGIHILQRLCQDGLLCFASHQEKQPAFALLEDWLPPGKQLTRDEALAELTLRYFSSHGPATVHDFAWWSGLKIADVKAGLEMTASSLRTITIEKTVYWMPREMELPTGKATKTFLLPGFDEYLLGYKDRSAALDPMHANKIVPGNNGFFYPTVVIGGRVVGTWKPVVKKDHITISVAPFAPLSKTQQRAINAATGPYRDFRGTVPVS